MKKLDSINMIFFNNYIRELKENNLTSFGVDDNDEAIEVIPILLEHFGLIPNKQLKQKYLKILEEKSRGWHINEQELVPVETVKEMLDEIYGSDEE